MATYCGGPAISRSAATGRYFANTHCGIHLMTVLQREAIDSIRELGGDSPDLLTQIVRMYFDTAPALIAQLKAALASCDVQGIRSAAHSLKSSSANLGAMQLSQLCGRLEA